MDQARAGIVVLLLAGVGAFAFLRREWKQEAARLRSQVVHLQYQLENQHEAGVQAAKAAAKAALQQLREDAPRAGAHTAGSSSAVGVTAYPLPGAPPQPTRPPTPPPTRSPWNAQLTANRERSLAEQCRPSQLQSRELGDRALDRLAQNSSTLGGMAPSQYRLVMKEILRRRPTGLLVFSVGSDTAIWQALNANGTSVFLEDSPQWAKMVRAKVPAADIRLVNFTTNAGSCAYDSRRIMGTDPKLALQHALVRDLPELRRSLWQTEWRIIHVDGPSGFTRGRLQPILMAVWLGCHVVRTKGGSVSVLLHDVERGCENEMWMQFFRGQLAECQMWPTAERTATGARPANPDITLQRYELTADHPTCANLVLPPPAKRQRP